MKKIYFIFLFSFYMILLSQAQVVTYNMPISPSPTDGMVNIRQTTNFEDFCFSAFSEARPNVFNTPWGVQWMSTNTNTPSAMTVEINYVNKPNGGPYPKTFNGIAQSAYTPATINCVSTTVADVAFDLGDYNSNAMNTVLFDFTGFGEPYLTFNGAWGFPPAIYGRVIVDYGPGLPIELQHFEVQLEGKQVLLQWQTASELNNDFFTVERSIDGVEWTAIETIKGSGSSAQAKQYETIDPNPLYGDNYYRLKQTDFDGTTWYSKPHVLSLERKANTVAIYPNPAQNLLMIEEAVGYTTTMHDALGRLVPIEVLPAGHHLRINTSSLEEGIYYLTIFDDARRLGNTEKIVILR